MARIAIFGAGGHAKVLADLAEEMNCEEICIFDDQWPTVRACGDWKVEGGMTELLQSLQRFDGVLIAIGRNDVRQAVAVRLSDLGVPLPAFSHPTAYVSRSASLGFGTVVLANAVENADARLGVACIVNTAATVDHDCVVGDAVHISPGANLAGGVHVGDGSWIGIGACVIQKVRIGKNVVVGAGAAVINDIPDDTKVVGVPAAPVRVRNLS